MIEVEKKGLLFKSTTVRRVLTAEGRALREATDPAPVQALLDASAARGEFGTRLTQEVQQGLNARTIEQEAPDFDYGD